MTAQDKQLSIFNWKNALATGDTVNTRLSEILKHRLLLNNGGLRVRSVNVTKNDRHLIVTFEDNATIRVVDLEKLDGGQRGATIDMLEEILVRLKRDC